jgi:hypothetical protein
MRRSQRLPWIGALLLACEGGAPSATQRAAETVPLGPSTMEPAATSFEASRPKARVVPFDGGQARIEAGVLVERIEIAKEGRVKRESACAGPVATYDAISTFYARFQAAMVSDDRSTIISMLKFPLRTNGRKPPEVASPEELSARWDQVFTRRVKKKVALADPHDVFCRDGTTSMFGNGVVWAGVYDATLRVNVVNR